MNGNRKPASLEQVLREAYVRKNGVQPSEAQLQVMKGVVEVEQGLRALGAQVPGDEPLQPRGPLQ